MTKQEYFHSIQAKLSCFTDMGWHIGLKGEELCICDSIYNDHEECYVSYDGTQGNARTPDDDFGKAIQKAVDEVNTEIAKGTPVQLYVLSKHNGETPEIAKMLLESGIPAEHIFVTSAHYWFDLYEDPELKADLLKVAQSIPEAQICGINMGTTLTCIHELAGRTYDISDDYSGFFDHTPVMKQVADILGTELTLRQQYICAYNEKSVYDVLKLCAENGLTKEQAFDVVRDISETTLEQKVSAGLGKPEYRQEALDAINQAIKDKGDDTCLIMYEQPEYLVGTIRSLLPLQEYQGGLCIVCESKYGERVYYYGPEDKCDEIDDWYDKYGIIGCSDVTPDGHGYAMLFKDDEYGDFDTWDDCLDVIVNDNPKTLDYDTEFGIDVPEKESTDITNDGEDR